MERTRSYRQLHRGKGLVYFKIKIKQTDLDIGACCRLEKQALELTAACRRDIEGYIKRDRRFLTSLVPIDCLPDAPDIVLGMCNAARKAGVGPMAAVAGAVSEYVGRGLLKYSCEVIVENGGDIFLRSSSERVIGIYAGDSPLGYRIAIRIPASSTPIGICTSAGRVGHSLSFGNADAVVVLSKDTALADAVATAAGNKVKDARDIHRAVDFAGSIEGVSGVLVIAGDKFGVWGDISLTPMKK